MDSAQLKHLEDKLWESADNLRANSKLTATEYSMPVLGLIFLRHATNRFDRVHEKVKAKLPSRGGKTRAVTAEDFASEGAIFLPEEARYDTLADLREDKDIGKAIKEAMEAVEAQVPDLLDGVLPKDYPKFEPSLLRDLVRVFNSEELRKATDDDLFGRIYEYFLNKFAMSGAQEGGEFFTPPSLVRTIVNFIEPTEGLILDPAVGSAGMFVQAAHAIEAQDRKPSEVASFFGQEKSETNTRLALMNLAVHGLEGKIQQGNTFYERLEDKVGKCDFVMANPPFNVDMVDPVKLKGDPRLLAKVKDLGVSKKTNAVSNANYLWIQYFYGYLKKASGRAGFVMAQSATDAGHWEKKIRKQLVETGDVDIMVSIGTNFFYTRSLPCSLWFFDRGRSAERKHKTLMLDARNVYRVISRKIRDFSEEQLANLTAIVWLYRGETDRYLKLVERYLRASCEAVTGLKPALAALDAPTEKLTKLLSALDEGAPDDADTDALAVFRDTARERTAALTSFKEARSGLLKGLESWSAKHSQVPADNTGQVAHHDSFEPFVERLAALRKHVNEVHKLTARALDGARRDLGATKWEAWDGREVRKHRDALDTARREALEAVKSVTYPFAQATWLQSRFPEAVFVDVPGLCAVVTADKIKEEDYSLTPGRYVGVAPPEPEDEEAVAERLREIHVELASLNEESSNLAASIANNFKELVE